MKIFQHEHISARIFITTVLLMLRMSISLCYLATIIYIAIYRNLRFRSPVNLVDRVRCHMIIETSSETSFVGQFR